MHPQEKLYALQLLSHTKGNLPFLIFMACRKFVFLHCNTSVMGAILSHLHDTKHIKVLQLHRDLELNELLNL